MSAAPSETNSDIVTALDALPCGALMARSDGSIIHANPRLSEWIGIPASGLRGRRISELISKEDGAIVERLLAPGMKQCDGTAKLIGRDGSSLEVVISGRRSEEGGPIVVTITDVSKLRISESQLREQYQEIAKLSDTVLEQALELKRYSKTLEERVRERTRELHEANLEAVCMLAIASEKRDMDTGAHVMRIREYAESIARELGISEAEVERTGYSAVLHDVGKISVSDQILKKPGPLTDLEREEMQRHTVVGEHILSKKGFFETARGIARSHHENWDGTGYPDQLKGESIPIAARIVRVADVFDALATKRVYKEPWPVDRAIGLIRDGEGSLFDSRVARAFLAIHESGQVSRILRGLDGGQ